MGLFNDPNTALMARNQQDRLNDQRAMAATPGRGYVGAARQAGRGLGRGLFGDPVQEKANKMKSVQNFVMQTAQQQGIKPGSEDFFKLAIGALQKAGMNREAMQMGLQAQKHLMATRKGELGIQKTEAEIEELKRGKTSSTPFIKNYEYIKASKGEEVADQYFSAWINKGLSTGKITKVTNTDGSTTFHDQSGKQVGVARGADGKPVISIKATTEARLREGEDRRQTDYDRKVINDSNKSWRQFSSKQDDFLHHWDTVSKHQKDPSRRSVTDRALIYAFAHTLDPRDRITQADLEGITRLGNYLERVGLSVQNIWAGAELPDDVREQMQAMIEDYASTLKERRSALETNLIDQSAKLGVEWHPPTDKKTSDEEYEAMKKEAGL